jgi:hypothetical protein
MRLLPLEILVFLLIAYGLFKLFCRLANSKAFGKSVAQVKGTPDDLDEVIDEMDRVRACGTTIADETAARVVSDAKKVKKFRTQ